MHDALLNDPESPRTIHDATVVANAALCRDHFRLTVRVASFALAAPGQFVHVSPPLSELPDYRSWAPDSSAVDRREVQVAVPNPLLRRAFSIAGLRRTHEGVDIDIIHRVVGTCTRWLASLKPGASLSLLGPLGNAFPVRIDKRHAWMVAGGVGLPPMLWLASALRGVHRDAVALIGAQSKDLLALELSKSIEPDGSAMAATESSVEFAQWGVPVVISTDDGSLGFRGHVGAALEALYGASGVAPGDLVVYTCGPERMMRFVADFCQARGVECYVCMERNMACGLGTCQSCVVPIHDVADPDAWRYALCCTEGPVFEASKVMWA